MGNERGGAINRLNRLSWTKQATNCLWPTATDHGPTGYCYRARPAATIKGDDLSNGFISNSAVDQSRRKMTTQYKSKEFVSSSDSSDLSDNGKKTVGSGESKRIAKREKDKDRQKTRVKGSSSRSSDDRSSNRTTNVIIIGVRNKKPKTEKPRTMDTVLVDTVPVLMDTVPVDTVPALMDTVPVLMDTVPAPGPNENGEVLSELPQLLHHRHLKIQSNQVGSSRHLCLQSNLQI